MNVKINGLVILDDFHRCQIIVVLDKLYIIKIKINFIVNE